MRLAIVGAQSTGKTELLTAIKRFWPMYKTPEKSYRDIIKEQNLSINKETNQTSQQAIRDAISIMIEQNAAEKYVLYDRCLLDNIAYTLWAVDKKIITDDEFIANSIHMCRFSNKMIDVIFWCSADPSIPIENKEQREIDLGFRQEIDNIFSGIYDSYKANEGILFERDDMPAFIPLPHGLNERILAIQEYVNPQGDLVESTSSIFDDMSSAFEQDNFVAEVKRG